MEKSRSKNGNEMRPLNAKLLLLNRVTNKIQQLLGCFHLHLRPYTFQLSLPKQKCAFVHMWGLQSARGVRGQGLVNTPSCEVTVSRVRGEWPVCRTAATPDRLIALPPPAPSANLLRCPVKGNRVGFQALKSSQGGDLLD